MVIRKRLLSITAAVLMVSYVSSYWVIRASKTVIHERDGCPQRGCEEVFFPGDGFYAIYGPIYQLDKLTDPQTDFVVIRID